MAITFNEVLKRKCTFDASGIDNPQEWFWDTYTNTDVYYPVRRRLNFEINTVNELICELMKIKDKNQPIFIFSECDMFSIIDIDTTLTDRVDINVKLQK